MPTAIPAKLGRLLCYALAGALVGAALSAAAAWAHDGVNVEHGSDIAVVYENHHHIDWCDRELDGNRVRAWYQYTSSLGSIKAQPTDWDPNGSNSGCGHENPLNCPGFCALLSFQVCEENVGCSNWKGG